VKAVSQFGTSGESFEGGIAAHCRKEPLAVVSAISPWNFPFNVPYRKLVPVFKESGFSLPEAGSAGIAFFQKEKAIYYSQ